jgi:hypothetical protein
MRRRVLMSVAFLALACGVPCAAQEVAPLSFDVTVGVSAGSSSAPHSSSVGFSADALVGFRPGARARASGGWVIGVSGSGQGLGVHEASCDVVPGGSCAPDFPAFWMLSMPIGWETRNGSARFLVGPAVARSSSALAGAVQARVELSQSIASRASLLASGRLTSIPSYRGESFQLGSVGVGFRLH